MSEITCPECKYKGHGRARHKPGCPHKGTHGGRRTDPRGGRIDTSVNPRRWASWLAFKGERTSQAAMNQLIDEALIDAPLKPKKTRLKKD
jgi:hypothetical protein